MAKEEERITDKLQVVKRNGKKVEFNASKIAIAIKKGFDEIIERQIDDDGVAKYSEKDMQKVFQDVLARIEKEYKDKDKIKIEEIQDLIETSLKAKKYDDVYQCFSDYRERRAQSRAAFTDDRLQRKYPGRAEGICRSD